MKKLFTIVLMVIVLQGIAQDAAVQLIARAQKDRIILRWAPTSAVAWQLANKYGYTIERYTVFRDSVLLNPREFVTMQPPIIKPLPLEAWEEFGDDDYSTVAAQAMYGETFELTEDYSKDIVQVINKAKEQEQRFSFALFAADQSFDVAQRSGLGIVDYLVKPGEKYLYRAYANIPQETYALDTGLVYISLEEFAPLPEIINVDVEFGDRMAMIRWDKRFSEKSYSSYIVERSEDGENFTSITDKPIINAYSDDNIDPNSFFKIDSLKENTKLYEYRVRGITPFGETGPPSAIVEGMGRPVIDANATIMSHKILGEQIELDWQYPDDKESLIDGFILEFADQAKGPFRSSGTLISKSNRKVSVNPGLSTVYFRMGLKVENVITNYSFPYLVQLEDSIPPAIPFGFNSSIDSLGRISVAWSPNTEPDFLGYRVFRSNFKSAEFAEMTSAPISFSGFEDSVSINNLTGNIYYKVVSVDKRYNESTFSELIEIAKPDIVPPTPPVVSRYESRVDGAFLEWAPSSSSDVVKHIIYRNNLTDNIWEVIGEVTESNIYLDGSASAGKKYMYAVVAIDENFLQSEPSPPVIVRKLKGNAKIEFESLTGRVNSAQKRIVLFWRLSNEEIDKILIYRAENDQSISLYRRIDSSDQFADVQVSQNNTYTYQLKAVLRDGRESGFSEKLSINFE